MRPIELFFYREMRKLSIEDYELEKIKTLKRKHIPRLIIVTFGMSLMSAESI